MIKISVIIPIYNSEKFLSQCLESVCNQTLRELEIICINDCSTDLSAKILQEFAKKDQRIKIIDLKENKGAAAARNLGIKNALGQYLGFVDSDDFIDLNFYEKLYQKALEIDADCVKGNMIKFCPQTKSKTKESWFDINEKVRQHKANFCCTFTSAIYKTEFIKKNTIEFPQGLIYFEDPYFSIKAALFYQKLEVLDDVFYYYVNNPTSVARQKFTINYIDSFNCGIAKITEILDQYCLDKNHYLIVFNFLLEQVLFYCNRFDVSDEISKKSVDGLFLLFKSCKFREESMLHYFLQKKKEFAKSLRNKIKHEINS